jgi:hypothetical protein
MGLEVDFPAILPEDLNPDWPLGSENLAQGDNHIRLTKRSLVNFYNNYQLYTQQNELRFQGDVAKEALVAQDSQQLAGRSADDYALKIGDYEQLRARATTKDDVELGQVDNYPTATAIENNNKKFTPVSLLYQLQQQVAEDIKTKTARKQYINELRTDTTAFSSGFQTMLELRVSDPLVAGYMFALPAGTFRSIVTSGSANGTNGRGALRITWNGTQIAYIEDVTENVQNNSPEQTFISLNTAVALDMVANQTNILKFEYRHMSVLGNSQISLDLKGLAEVFRPTTIMTVL